MDRIKLAQEALDIIKAGYYETDGRRVPLGLSAEQTSDVKIYTPELVRDCAEKAANGGFSRYENTEVFADRLETFTSVRENGIGKTIALNFANAYRPGGGFLHGAAAQEENLCRISTLYASISSDKAKAVYEYNAKSGEPAGSDHILYSPTVSIFRDEEAAFLPSPVITSVVTSAAPNLNGDAATLSQDEANALMKRKIENVIAVCAAEHAETVILGAWGCGAFCHSAKTVAGLFREVLFDRGYKQYFKRVVFSVYSAKGITTSNTVNFINAFGKKPQ